MQEVYSILIMILLLGVVIFGVLLSVIYGWILEFIAVKFLKLNDDHNLHFSITILLGVALLSGLLGAWSFYHGIGTRAVVFFSLLALLVLVGMRKYISTRIRVIYGQLKSLGILPWLIFALVAIYAIYLASAATPTADTGLYHAQAIRWIEYYPVVPGLANLHPRLGFNSAVFLLAAFWGFVWIGLHTYQIPGLIIFLSVLLYCLHFWGESQDEFSIGRLAALGVLAYLLLDVHLLVWLASPTTDLPSALVTWAVFLAMTEKIESASVSRLDMNMMAIATLCLFDITIKVSTAPILIIPLYLLWETRAWTSLTRVFTFGVLMIPEFLPWAARNVILTGYLVFPFYQLDIFDFDWKVPAALAKYYSILVLSWGRLPYTDAGIVMSMNFAQWLPRWYQTLAPDDLFLINALLVGLVLLTIYWVSGKPARQHMRFYYPIYAVCIVGLIFWFIESPSPRFGYGFLVTTLCFLYAPIIKFLAGSFKLLSKQAFLLVQLVLAIYLIYALAQIPLSSWRHYLSTFKSYPVVDTTSVRLDGQSILVPVNGGQCWYASFPCTPSIVSGLKMRGPKIEDGFEVLER